MGKAKKRILNKGIHDQIPNMTRNAAIQEVLKAFKQQNRNEAVNLITLFGLSGEELMEAGAYWEDVTLLEGVLND